ncbi:flagellar biosynthesis protein FlhF [Alteromonas ponticola]|uniref:Flagellar biosynthesis protein FlhF n=1 Tax=Alteromonas ponticola TaxID=2720613 RepID=A0ABX1QZE8_9ALTE|nr:flagellar biosynthesis protein FlhF [Alteromonas ponticola]NMH59613.1 flagellar biosynthesis protein FlhF [Alteromonas ponticola]
MKIRRFFGKDMREALNKVKDELGSDAVIMSNRKVADGIELVAAYDKEPEVKLGNVKRRHAESPTKNGKPTPSLSEIIGDDGPDSLRALLEKQHAGVADAIKAQRPVPSPAATPPPSARPVAPSTTVKEDYLQFDDDLMDTMPAREKEPSARYENNDLASIKEEIESLRNVLQFQLAELKQEKKSRHLPSHQYLAHSLTQMGLSEALAEQLINFTPKEYGEREAWVYLLNLLSNRLQIAGNDILRQTGVVALVGPTGTGKTTTVAKLAARYAQRHGADQVAMITVDTYRIAAFEQLATYGKIIGCTVRKAQSSEELAEQLFQLRHKKLILIDTAGFSQRDSRLIKQLAQFDDGQMQPVKKYLVAQANTQYAAMQRIVDAYSRIKLDGCIFTKLDECYSLGEILSIAVENQLSVSYVTDGQQVPEDIKIADAKSLVSAAAKLYKKYGLNHTTSNQVVNAARAV